MTTKIQGQLEIDHKRGVVYFHSDATGWTVLRICQMGEIPQATQFIDINIPSRTVVCEPEYCAVERRK